MSIEDELKSARINVDRVREGKVEAIVFSDEHGKHMFKTVSIEEERPEGTIGYRVVSHNPGVFTEETYVSIGVAELEIIHKPKKCRQFIRTDHIIPK